MSAYMVEDETINRVVEWLRWEVGSSPDLKKQLEGTLGIDTTRDQWHGKLG